MAESRFELQFDTDPWQCRIIKAGEVVLHISAKYKITHSEINKNEYRFHFQDSSVLIQTGETKISFKWQGKAVKVQFPLSGFWYGGGELVNQPLLWNQIMLPLTKFITSDNGPTGLSTILSPTWFSSLGVGLTVAGPFSVGINQPPARYLQRPEWMSTDLIPFEWRPYIDHKGHGDRKFTLVGDDLNFEVRVEDNILQAYQAQVKDQGLPQKTPPLELMGAPIWTTWARYKDRIDQETVLQFAREIKENGYPYHVLEIDDRWQTQYGDLEFDPKRFPDPKAMIRELHQMGFKVTVWVMPFFHPQINCRAGRGQSRLSCQGRRRRSLPSDLVAGKGIPAGCHPSRGSGLVQSQPGTF